MKTWCVRVYFSMPTKWLQQMGALDDKKRPCRPFIDYPAIEAETSHEAAYAAVNLAKLDRPGAHNFTMAHTVAKDEEWHHALAGMGSRPE